MTSQRPGRAGTLLVLALLLTACGGGSSSTTAGDSGAPTAADLDGTSYLSSSVEGYDLVPDTRISLTFEDGSLSANSGCNTMFGPYGVRHGTLSWTQGPAMTQMACADDRMQQDQWLAGLLQAGMEATLDGDALTLTSGDVTVHLETEKPADASALFGRTWKVTDLTTPSTATAIPDGVRAPTFEVSADGAVALDTGCNRGHTQATADGDVLTFAPVATTKMACPQPATEVEHAVLQALEGQVTVTIEGDTATLDNGQHGLVVQLGPSS